MKPSSRQFVPRPVRPVQTVRPQPGDGLRARAVRRAERAERAGRKTRVQLLNRPLRAYRLDA